jgi:hypothetical protein
MTDSQHLSDLELDRLRIARQAGGSNPEHLAHLNGCETCRHRVEEMDRLAEAARPDLAAALSKAEQEAHVRSRAVGMWIPALVATAACLVGLLVLWWPFTETGGDHDTVRVKGAPRLRVLRHGGKPVGDTLTIGQSVKVRMSGTPTVRDLVLKDLDGSYELLWPLGEESAEEGTAVELELEVEEPEGELKLFGLFGPAQLSRQAALDMARSFESEDAPEPAEGWVVIQKSFRVVRSP